MRLAGLVIGRVSTTRCVSGFGVVPAGVLQLHENTSMWSAVGQQAPRVVMQECSAGAGVCSNVCACMASQGLMCLTVWNVAFTVWVWVFEPVGYVLSYRDFRHLQQCLVDPVCSACGQRTCSQCMSGCCDEHMPCYAIGPCAHCNATPTLLAELQSYSLPLAHWSLLCGC